MCVLPHVVPPLSLRFLLPAQVVRPSMTLWSCKSIRPGRNQLIFETHRRPVFTGTCGFQGGCGRQVDSLRPTSARAVIGSGPRATLTDASKAPGPGNYKHEQSIGENPALHSVGLLLVIESLAESRDGNTGHPSWAGALHQGTLL